MALQKFAYCPWCGARIQLQKQNEGFYCPVCLSIFQYNWLTYILGIPTVLALLVMLSFIIGNFVIPLSIILIWLVVRYMKPFVVVKKGEEWLSREKVKAHVPARKESKWFIVLVILLDITIITILVFLILNSLAII